MAGRSREGFEKPGGVASVPLRRAGVSHPLQARFFSGLQPRPISSLRRRVDPRRFQKALVGAGGAPCLTVALILIVRGGRRRVSRRTYDQQKFVHFCRARA